MKRWPEIRKYAHNRNIPLREKYPNTEFFSGPYFPAFGWNTEIFEDLRIQSEYGKKQTIKNFVFGHFSHRVPVRVRKKR